MTLVAAKAKAAKDIFYGLGLELWALARGGPCSAILIEPIVKCQFSTSVTLVES